MKKKFFLFISELKEQRMPWKACFLMAESRLKKTKSTEVTNEKPLGNVKKGSFYHLFQQKQGGGCKSFTENDYFCIGFRLNVDPKTYWQWISVRYLFLSPETWKILKGQRPVRISVEEKIWWMLTHSVGWTYLYVWAISTASGKIKEVHASFISKRNNIIKQIKVVPDTDIGHWLWRNSCSPLSLHFLCWLWAV